MSDERAQRFARRRSVKTGGPLLVYHSPGPTRSIALIGVNHAISSPALLLLPFALHAFFSAARQSNQAKLWRGVFFTRVTRKSCPPAFSIFTRRERDTTGRSSIFDEAHETLFMRPSPVKQLRPSRSRREFLRVRTNVPRELSLSFARVPLFIARVNLSRRSCNQRSGQRNFSRSTLNANAKNRPVGRS